MSSQKLTGNSSILIGTLEDLYINEITGPHAQFRDQTDNTSDLESSIAEYGLLHPITVTIEHDRIMIVTGYRRYTACKKLGWKKIPCHVIDVKDHKTAYELGLVENLQRHSLNPIEEANAFRNYVSELGWGGVSELSKKIGKSPSYISRRLGLLSLPKEIRVLISDSLLSPSCGDELSTIKNEETKKLLKIIVRDHPTVRTIRQLKSQTGNEWYSNYTPDKSGNHGKFFDKSIVSLKIAARRLGELIQDLEDQSWILSEILMQHRNLVRAQINILIRQKKKYERQVRYSGKSLGV